MSSLQEISLSAVMDNLSPKSPRIWQSINADSKSKGGIVGISQSPAALERCFLTAHERATVTTALREMCGVDESNVIES